MTPDELRILVDEFRDTPSTEERVMRARLIVDALPALLDRLAAAEAQIRRLEDALLLLWHEVDHAALRDEFPELMDFCAHVHHSIEHEQAMVRRNSWLPPDELLARLAAAEAEADQLHGLLEQADDWIDSAVCGTCGSNDIAHRSEP
jgi:hypothetical protein